MFESHMFYERVNACVGKFSLNSCRTPCARSSGKKERNRKIPKEKAPNKCFFKNNVAPCKESWIDCLIINFAWLIQNWKESKITRHQFIGNANFFSVHQQKRHILAISLSVRGCWDVQLLNSIRLLLKSCEFCCFCCCMLGRAFLVHLYQRQFSTQRFCSRYPFVLRNWLRTWTIHVTQFENKTLELGEESTHDCMRTTTTTTNAGYHENE